MVCCWAFSVAVVLVLLLLSAAATFVLPLLSATVSLVLSLFSAASSLFILSSAAASSIAPFEVSSDFFEVSESLCLPLFLLPLDDALPFSDDPPSPSAFADFMLSSVSSFKALSSFSEVSSEDA